MPDEYKGIYCRRRLELPAHNSKLVAFFPSEDKNATLLKPLSGANALTENFCRSFARPKLIREVCSVAAIGEVNAVGIEVASSASEKPGVSKFNKGVFE